MYESKYIEAYMGRTFIRSTASFLLEDALSFEQVIALLAEIHARDIRSISKEIMAIKNIKDSSMNQKQLALAIAAAMIVELDKQ